MKSTIIYSTGGENPPQFSVTHPNGSATDFLSPNWCDDTTWYSTAERIVDEVAVDSGDGVTWTLKNAPIVDVKNAKITQEHKLHATHGVVVKVDGVELSETCNTNPQGGDYWVDYKGGKIVFASSQAGKSVTVTYSRVVDSTWIIAPDDGKKLRLTAVEVQFSDDIVMTDSVKFEVYGLVDVFAPHLMTTASPPGPYPPGTKISLRQRIYHTIMDFVNEAQRSFPVVPALGGTGWRGITKNVHVFRWPYAEDATRDLYSSSGMEIRISLVSHNEFMGTHAYATVYATSDDE